MRRYLAVCLSLAIAASAAAQKLERKDEPKDMATILQTAGKAFEAQRHAAALAALKKAMELASAELERAILAAMPKAPEGFTVRDDKRKGSGAMPLGLLGAVQVPVEWTCFKKGGKETLTIAVHGGGAMAGVVKMAMGLVGVDPNADKVVYEGAEAVLRRNAGNQQLELHALLGDHVLIVTSKHLSQEQLLLVVDQAFLTRLLDVLRTS